MQILELELHNWGPYRGVHTIELGVSEEAPVILFLGENMRGKTSLLRAIVWCLYGRLKQQDGRTPLDPAELVNRQALEDGDGEFGVRLLLSHRGEEFELRRTGRAAIGPMGPGITQQHVTMRPRVGNPFPEQQIAAEIERILSYQISDFFFFDGEMLIRFEERLQEDREASTRFIRDQIERALGLPFLKDLGSDLETIANALGSQIQRATRSNAKAAKLQTDLAQAEATLEAKARDRAQLQTDGEQLDVLIRAAEEQLSSVETIREAVAERKGLQGAVERDNADLADIREQLRQIVEADWWFPLAPRLAQEFKVATDRLVEAAGRQNATSMARARLEQVRAEIETSRCQTCGQPLDTDAVAKLREELHSLEISLPAEQEEDLTALNMRVGRLAPFAQGAGVTERIAELERDARRLRLRSARSKQRIAQIDESLQGNTLEIASIEADLREKKELRSSVARKIGETDRDIDALKLSRSNLRNEIAKLPEVMPLDRDRLELYSDAVEVVGRSFEQFRREMREQVQEEASEIFRRLTTEKDFAGVVLNEDYSLAILDPDGSPMNLPSAGANQVLTMAFIGALGASSTEEAPMVMDTPLGRLDKGHRQAILEWVGSMTSQVILFVQSGEFDPATDMALLQGNIGRMLRIERLGANSSRVVNA